jgi:hypothetical protein
MMNTVYKYSQQCHRKLNHQANGSLREPALYLPALKGGLLALSVERRTYRHD